MITGAVSNVISTLPVIGRKPPQSKVRMSTAPSDNKSDTGEHHSTHSMLDSIVASLASLNITEVFAPSRSDYFSKEEQEVMSSKQYVSQSNSTETIMPRELIKTVQDSVNMLLCLAHLKQDNDSSPKAEKGASMIHTLLLSTALGG